MLLIFCKQNFWSSFLHSRVRQEPLQFCQKVHECMSLAGTKIVKYSQKLIYLLMTQSRKTAYSIELNSSHIVCYNHESKFFNIFYAVIFAAIKQFSNLHFLIFESFQ